MASNSLELRRYLENGWAVASPSGVNSNHNGLLTEDDLVFNNAALYTLRHMDEFDTQRIALVVGSAGSYSTLMLSALQMGNCATIVTSPIANVYFNFYQYFQMANRKDAPFFLRLVKDSFLPVLENFPDVNDTDRWEAFSAVGLKDCFGSPIMITHATSDILVPVDQITREFTYAHEGSSMPEGYSTRLDKNNPGVLGHSLVNENKDGKAIIELLEKYCCKKVVDSEYQIRTGFGIDRIVFTYLDYVLCRDNPGEFKEFQFQFRTSIEHFFPQHPINGENAVDEKNRDSFGNLALITVSANSKFSNMLPIHKVEQYKDVIEQSPKLMRMKKLLDANNRVWDDIMVANHNEEMLKLLEVETKARV